MEVLVYKCDDYTITIKTSDIVVPWKRFDSRVPEVSRTYCDYSSTHEIGTLWLRKIDKDESSELVPLEEGREWLSQPPVMFETETYHFFIEFNCQLIGTPRIIHPLKEIADCFDYYKGMLAGSINFLNNPGTFILSFEYVKSDGEHIHDDFSLEIVSPKLDTKRDLDNIKKLINAEYENYVYEYLTLTFQNQQINPSERSDSKIIWLSIFKQVIEPYFKACRFIMEHANHRSVKHYDYSRAERIKRWDSHEEELYVERGKDADKYYYRHEVTERTINTKENRFVKHTLIYLQRQFSQVFSDMMVVYENELSQQAIDQLNKYTTTFRSLLNSKFFRSVGRYEGHLQESAVLQQRSGYRNVYKYWQMLKCGLSLEQGNTNIGMKQIWKLYEIWCFLVLKRLVCKTMGIDPSDRSAYEKGFIKEDSTRMIESFNQKDIEYHLTLKHPSKGTEVELWYQHHFFPNNDKEEHSVTTLQIPDIVLNVTKPNDTLTRTYLFDAKYRVLDDKQHDSPTDEPVQDAINAMHRYRDAIYYGNKTFSDGVNRPESREVIGGYILFPGRVSDADKLENKYFTRSIDAINIGAYPLLPKAFDETKPMKDWDLVECPRLEHDLRHIVLDESSEELLEKSIPQRGLYYTAEKPKDAIVYVGFVKDTNPFYQDFIDNEAKMYYTGGSDTKPDLDIQRIKYLMPIVKGRVCGVYPVTAINAARKSEKRANNDNTDDGVRFFLMLGAFEKFGEPVSVGRELHNADWMTYDEAVRRYRSQFTIHSSH